MTSVTEEQALDNYIGLVRSYLSDYSDMNYLQPDKEEFTNNIIGQAVLMALEIFNSCTGHITKYTLENFPVPTLLVLGGSGYTMLSGGVLQARNHFSVSDGNTSGPISEKTEIYRGWAQELISNFITLSAKFKEATNMEGAYKNFGSSYLLQNYYVRQLKRLEI